MKFIEILYFQHNYTLYTCIKRIKYNFIIFDYYREYNFRNELIKSYFYNRFLIRIIKQKKFRTAKEITN